MLEVVEEILKGVLPELSCWSRAGVGADFNEEEELMVVEEGEMTSALAAALGGVGGDVAVGAVEVDCGSLFLLMPCPTRSEKPVSSSEEEIMTGSISNSGIKIVLFFSPLTGTSVIRTRYWMVCL